MSAGIQAAGAVPSSSLRGQIIARPRRALFVLAYLICLCIQAGDLGAIDTVRRLRVTHSWWTDNPPVPKWDQANFGVIGRGGVVHAYYGAGQSALMFPADVIGSLLLRAAHLPDDDARAEKLRAAFVSFATFPLISALIVLLGFDLLMAFGFAVAESSLGALSLLLLTTLLPYTQINQENSLEFALTLGGYLAVARWLRTRRPVQLAIAGLCLGANLLVRPVTVIDAAMVALFAVLSLLWEPEGAVNATAPSPRRLPGVRDVLAAVAGFLVMVAIERLHHHHRFGVWGGTYYGILRVQEHAADPTLPAAYPFDGSFLHGFLGALFSPARSVFLFDGAILVTLILLALRWRSVPERVRAFAVSVVLLLLGTAAFYAKFENWGGASAWADRYCTTGSDLLGLLAVPLFLRLRRSLASPAVRAILVALLGYALLVQLLSVVFWYNLEEVQCAVARAGAACPVILWRVKNVVAMLLRHPPAGVAITPRTVTPNFFPFLAASTVGRHAALALQALWAFACASAVAATFVFARVWLRQTLSDDDRVR